MAKIKKALIKTLNNLRESLVIILGMLLAVSLVFVLLPISFYEKFFKGGFFINALIGGLLGSISTGSPLLSYIIGGELLEKGVGLMAVSAFIVCWVNVGVVQLPAEAMFLGRRFAVSRNIVSFILAILIAILTAITLWLIG